MDPVTLLLGRLPASSSTVVKVQVHNSDSVPISLLGMESSCGCLVSVTNAFRLEAGSRKELSFKITAPDGEVKFSRKVTATFRIGDTETRKTQEIHFEADTVRLFRSVPSVVCLDEVAKLANADSISSEIWFESLLGDDLRKFKISVSDRLVKSWVVLEQSERQVKLKLQYRDLGNVPFDEWDEQVRFTHESGGAVEIPLRLYLRGKYYGKPGKLVFDTEGFPKVARIVIAASDPSGEVKLESSRLIYNHSALENCHTLTEVLKARNLAVYKFEISQLPATFDAGIDMHLEVSIVGQSVPLAFFINVKME
jgi:hypothetical protein